MARAFLMPRTKTVAWALARATYAPTTPKHCVFPPKEVRLTLPFDFCPPRHSCSAQSLKNIGDFKSDEKLVRGLKPTLRVVGSPRHKVQGNHSAVFRVFRVFRG